MKVYVFGNQDHAQDSFAISVVKEIQARIESGKIDDLGDLKFEFVKPNQDLPFENGENVVLMDVVKGINEVKLIEEENLDKLKITSSSSVHDFDLGFQIKYLKKLGKLGKVTVIGLPFTFEFSKISEILDLLGSINQSVLD